MSSAEPIVEDVPYVVHDGEAFLARVYRPPSSGAAVPGVLYVHPGGWHAGDRTWGELFTQALARRGFLVASIDFRQAPRFRHPAASADVATGVRWLRAAGDALGLDPARIGIVGSSSGGHLGLLAACRPNEPEHAGRPLAWAGDGSVDADVDAAVRCVAALWSPADPAARYRWALKRVESGPSALRDLYETLSRAGEWYFGDEETMHAASIPRLVAAGEATHLPEVWVCQPELDENVPYEIVAALGEAWEAAGGEITVTVYERQNHAFGHHPGPDTDRFVDDLAAFLDRALAPGR